MSNYFLSLSFVAPTTSPPLMSVNKDNLVEFPPRGKDEQICANGVCSIDDNFMNRLKQRRAGHQNETA